MRELRSASARYHAGQVWPASFVAGALWLLGGGLLALAGLRAAGAEANAGVGVSYRVRGEGVELFRDGGWERVGQGSPSIPRWEPGQRLRTGAHGNIVLRLQKVGWVIITENTEVGLSEFQPAAWDGSTSGRVVLRLERGRLFAQNAGREYVLEVTFGDGAMGVREAAVFGLSANGRLSLYEGQSVLVLRASASGPQGVSVMAPQTFEPGVGLRPLSREEKEAPEWRFIEESSQPMAAAAPPSPEAPWPKFPWPPPEASGRVQIPDAFVRKDEPSTLGDLASRLEGALTEAEYAQWSYFAAPWGFVLVTCLEQVEEDGTPKEGDARWAIDAGELKRFTLKSYLKALFKADPGHFRVVAIVVTTDSFATSGNRPGRDEAVKWLSKGVNRLPSEIAQRPYTAAHACTALVYEFEKPVGKQRAVAVVPGRLPARRHLERAGVWNGLERRGPGL